MVQRDGKSATLSVVRLSIVTWLGSISKSCGSVCFSNMSSLNLKKSSAFVYNILEPTVILRLK